MPTYTDYCESLAAKIRDYREGELAPPDAEHVDRWAQQFDPNDQITIVSEMDHLFSDLYFGKEWVHGRTSQAEKPGIEGSKYTRHFRNKITRSRSTPHIARIPCPTLCVTESH
ncbi:hypothetical protein [Kordiimonas marina]|uniref:hypothetical protein n=1 Tax=Kordiimonas marina TaxID=2872312 RepID=UPI001FF34F03|nr:hypothetical protein [Kordiimonas marina]MCJ9430018.1 hypothetical protein [Kordiimonas marina]